MILIVDDHVDTCAALASFLTWDNQYSTSVHSGRAAIEWLSAQLPAVMVLDDNMPGMDGLEVLRELRKNTRYKALPIVMYSAGQNPERQAIATQLGAAAWITKGRTSWRDVAEKVVSLLPRESAAPALAD